MNAWRSTGPELAVAAGVTIAAGAAGYALAGAGGAAVVAVAAAAGWLVLLRFLAPGQDMGPGGQAAAMPASPRGSATPAGGLRTAALGPHAFAGHWRAVFQVKQATRSMAGFDTQLRPRLEHLLAARLSHRHGVNLYSDPAAARRLLCGADGDDLWQWIDPLRPATRDGSARGISRRTLARLVARLERL